jgi:hypothetical protein
MMFFMIITAMNYEIITTHIFQKEAQVLELSLLLHGCLSVLLMLAS